MPLEEDIIQWSLDLPGAEVPGRRDDAAVLKKGDSYRLFATDMLVENTHFTLDLPPIDLGYKALAVNLSDMAAMGGVGQEVMLSLGVPPHCSQEWLKAFFEGLKECASRFGVRLIGGDTVKSAVLTVNLATMGETPRPIYRTGARAGDLLLLAGELGCAAAGLLCWQKGLDYPFLKRSHVRPEPLLEQAVSWQSFSRIAMLDLSDSLGRSLEILSSENHLGVALDLNAFPLHPELKQFCIQQGVSPLDFLLYGGEDYALLAAVPEEELQKQGLGEACVLGRLRAEKHWDLRYNGESVTYDAGKNYLHFA